MSQSCLTLHPTRFYVLLSLALHYTQLYFMPSSGSCSACPWIIFNVYSENAYSALYWPQLSSFPAWPYITLRLHVLSTAPSLLMSCFSCLAPQKISSCSGLLCLVAHLPTLLCIITAAIRSGVLDDTSSAAVLLHLHTCHHPHFHMRCICYINVCLLQCGHWDHNCLIVSLARGQNLKLAW